MSSSGQRKPRRMSLFPESIQTSYSRRHYAVSLSIRIAEHLPPEQSCLEIQRCQDTDCEAAGRAPFHHLHSTVDRWCLRHCTEFSALHRTGAAQRCRPVTWSPPATASGCYGSAGGPCGNDSAYWTGLAGNLHTHLSSPAVVGFAWWAIRSLDRMLCGGGDGHQLVSQRSPRASRSVSFANSGWVDNWPESR